MRLIPFIAPLLVAFVLGSVAAAADVTLPAPKKSGGPPLYDAIDHRGSATGGQFPKGKVGPDDLATILWAATGQNRGGELWTVPMAMGRPPYCKIYVADDTGAYRYDWKRNALVKVADGNVKSQLALQDFAKNAPQLLLFVMDGEELAKFGSNSPADEFGLVLIGAMSQNIYLAADGLGVGVRLVFSVNRENMTKILQLSPGDRPICGMPIGKR